ncbi:MAG: hypothetical protein PF448_13060 [Bacteroidales bacterium]|jgi:hypothetical protein|nr:hypothetical protein [Bacteroidales bacterium]
MQDPKVKTKDPTVRAAVLMEAVSNFKDFNENNMVKGVLLNLLANFINSDEINLISTTEKEDISLSVKMINGLVDAIYDY